MNQIVSIALSKPYTFVVLAILIVLFGTMSVAQTPTDVFPNIKIPVISVGWSYAGLLPNVVSARITFFFGGHVYRAAVLAARPSPDYTARDPALRRVAIPLEEAHILWQR